MTYFNLDIYRSDISTGSRRGVGTVNIGGLAITGSGSPKPGLSPTGSARGLRPGRPGSAGSRAGSSSSRRSADNR